MSLAGQPAYGNCCLVTTWVGIAHDCFELGWPVSFACIRSTANGPESNQHWAMVSLTHPDLTPATVAGSWSIPRKKTSPAFFPAALRAACAAGGQVDVMHTTALSFGYPSSMAVMTFWSFAVLPLPSSQATTLSPGYLAAASCLKPFT